MGGSGERDRDRDRDGRQRQKRENLRRVLQPCSLVLVCSCVWRKCWQMDRFNKKAEETNPMSSTKLEIVEASPGHRGTPSDSVDCRAVRGC